VCEEDVIETLETEEIDQTGLSEKSRGEGLVTGVHPESIQRSSNLPADGGKSI